MQSYSINSQKRKLQAVIVAFIIITMLSQWFVPLVAHAESLTDRIIHFNVRSVLTSIKDTTVVSTYDNSASVKGVGHFVAKSFRFEDKTNDKFGAVLYVYSDKPFTYGGDNADMYNCLTKKGIYYCALGFQSSALSSFTYSYTGLINCTDYSSESAYNTAIENSFNTLDLSKDDYKKISYDTDTRHDFGSDIVDTSIPTPELTNITHNGFIVSNMGDYYIDVYTESFLYGVSMKKITSRWLPEVDTSWVYSSHKYNFVDLSDVAVSSSNVNIKTLWNVDNESNLVNDFKKWSSEFPDINSLPSYSFTKGSSAGSTQYNLNHNYNKVIGDNDSEKLRTSAQACTVFYVRFYTKDIKCGQWMKYTYRDGAKNAGASVTVEQVSFSKTGEETTIDKAEGRQDYDTGITDFDSSNDLSFDLTDVDSFFNYLTSIFDSCKNSVSAFASLIYACVPFLPPELINVIALAIVIMLFIGIIKAVVS